MLLLHIKAPLRKKKQFLKILSENVKCNLGKLFHFTLKLLKKGLLKINIF